MTIAIVTAYNLGNMGMYTVDRAINENLGGRSEYQIFCSHGLPRRLRRTALKFGIDLGMRNPYYQGINKKKLYQNITDLSDFDKIVFWGDFTLNVNYGYGDSDFIDRDVSFRLVSEKEAAARWRELFSTDVLQGKKILSFGQNFQHLSLCSDGKYFDEQKTVLSGLTHIAPRDSVSLGRVKDMNVSNCTVSMGCDPAFLKLLDSSIDNSGASFSYYFGRSGINNSKDLVSSVSDRLGLPAVGLLGWLGDDSDYETRWQDYRRKIANSHFVLTDTYHCAVNAIALGKIPLVISGAATSQDGTLGGHKKYTLLKDADLEEYHFALDESLLFGMAETDKLISTASEIMNEPQSEYQKRFERVSSIVSSAKRDLLDFLDS